MRDLRIDWLRGLAMTCVIVNHSRLTSLLSSVSYERFWVVTAAEVFVVLSGVVLGTVYGRRLARDGWRAVVRGLGRRAALLYVSFVAVTASLVLLAATGMDVQVAATGTNPASDWFANPQGMTATAWRDLLLMRSGPWQFEIVGLYVWLVAAAVPCLFAIRAAGWRPVLAVSWAVYLAYRISPHPLTSAEFEQVFPLPAWQLLFVHGIVIGYFREQVTAFVDEHRMLVWSAAAGASAAFMIFALSNPKVAVPSVYGTYFGLSHLGVGRLLNLAVGLSLAYGMLTWGWRAASRLQGLIVTLGQQSLGAFVLHVYALVLLDRLPRDNGLWINTLLQIAMIVGIAVTLRAVHGRRDELRTKKVDLRTRPALG